MKNERWRWKRVGRSSRKREELKKVEMTRRDNTETGGEKQGKSFG
jgi:hypothetical protein